MYCFLNNTIIKSHFPLYKIQVYFFHYSNENLEGKFDMKTKIINVHKYICIFLNK